MSVVSHLAGAPITVRADPGLWMRQRCQWCEAVLADYDLRNTEVPEGQEGPCGWEVGAWIRVDDDGCPIVYTVAEHDDGKFPDDSCIAIEFPKLRPILKVVA